LSVATKNRYLAMLRSIFRFAVDQGYCAQDPTRSLKLGREIAVKTYEVNDDLTGRLMSAALWLEDRYPKTAFLAQLLLLTGMRIGEALSLTWGDVDLSARHITLRLTKSGKVRHVPISGDCRGLLKRLKEADFSQAPEGWLFPSANTESHMTRPVRPWKLACRAVGLPISLRFHDLRHIFASACVKEGIPLYTVQGLLGHSSIRMTERYASLARDDLFAASERVAHSLCSHVGGAQ
jgi:integrase